MSKHHSQGSHHHVLSKLEIRWLNVPVVRVDPRWASHKVLLDKLGITTRL